MSLLTTLNRGIARSGLVAWYRFNEGSGQVLGDWSGRGNHGQLGSTPGADTNDPAWDGQGLTFATDDFIDIDAVNLNFAQKTIIGVVKPANITDTYKRLLASKNTYASFFTFGINEGKIMFTDNDNVNARVPSTVLSTSSPTCVGVMYDGILANTKIYLGKTPVSTASGVGWIASTKNLIGARYDGSDYSGQYNGQILALLVYNRLLTEAEYYRNVNALRAELARRGVVLPV